MTKSYTLQRQGSSKLTSEGPKQFPKGQARGDSDIGGSLRTCDPVMRRDKGLCTGLDPSFIGLCCGDLLR